MTLSELIETLTEIAEVEGGDLKVKIATQPSYPIAHEVQNVRVLSDADEDVDDEGEVFGTETEKTLWIAADQLSSWDESPYAPAAAWEQE